MRHFKNSTIMLVVFFCVLASNGLNAKILWEKELALDANTNSAPLASCLNKDGNGIIVMTVESPKGSFPIKGDNILWEIGANGNAIRILPKNTDGSKVWTNAKPAGVGPGCAIASDSRMGTAPIPFSGVATGGELILAWASRQNMPIVAIQTQPGESAESVAERSSMTAPPPPEIPQPCSPPCCVSVFPIPLLCYPCIFDFDNKEEHLVQNDTCK